MTARLPPVLLASTSPYRRALLGRLLPNFEQDQPRVEEAFEAGESPEAGALRLARLKALDCAARRPECLVIGGDQVPALDGKPLQKPGSHERAVEQLTACAGRRVDFFTAVAITGPNAAAMETHVDRTTICFRHLTKDEIERYLRQDQPYDCAGSFKAESLGIALFERFETADPTAIQGLPLIWLANCLRQRGLDLP